MIPSVLIRVECRIRVPVPVPVVVLVLVLVLVTRHASRVAPCLVLSIDLIHCGNEFRNSKGRSLPVLPVLPMLLTPNGRGRTDIREARRCLLSIVY